MDFKTEKFNGPLDLLLSLVQENEFSINDVALSEVTEQYLDYVDQFSEIDADELSDFLLVASRLLYLKSRALLPQLMPEEEAGQDLADQLKLYKKFLEASKKINDIWLNPSMSFSRIEPARIPEIPEMPKNLKKKELKQSMLNLLHRIKPPKPIPRAYIDKAVSLKETITKMRNFLKNRKSFNFSEVLSSSENKTELIVGFLAVLELVKQKTVMLKQDDMFGEILIERF